MSKTKRKKKSNTLSFSRAAERCYVSQPALSTQIQQLERIFGLQLFERSPRQVRLTHGAQPLLERTRSIVAAVEELMESAKAEVAVAESSEGDEGAQASKLEELANRRRS